MITSATFTITYGEKIAEMDHEYVSMAQTAMHGQVEAIAPCKFIAESLPFLLNIPSWVPFTDAKRVVEKYAPFVATARDKPYADVQEKMVRASIFLMSAIVTFCVESWRRCSLHGH